MKKEVCGGSCYMILPNNSKYRIYYSFKENSKIIHVLSLPERPFQAIKIGQKKVETRTQSDKIGSYDYSIILPGDYLQFIHELTGEILEIEIERVTHYKSVRLLLENEGVELTLSSGKDIEGGTNSINSIPGYKQSIKENGIYALKMV